MMELLGGWKIWVIGAAVLALVSYISVTQITLAHRAAQIASLSEERDVLKQQLADASHDLDASHAVNTANDATLKQLRADSKTTIDALTAERDAAVLRAGQTKIIKETIHAADIKACGPLPPAFMAAVSGVRNRNRAAAEGGVSGPVH